MSRWTFALAAVLTLSVMGGQALAQEREVMIQVRADAVSLMMATGTLAESPELIQEALGDILRVVSEFQSETTENAPRVCVYSLLLRADDATVNITGKSAAAAHTALGEVLGRALDLQHRMARDFPGIRASCGVYADKLDVSVAGESLTVIPRAYGELATWGADLQRTIAEDSADMEVSCMVQVGPREAVPAKPDPTGPAAQTTSPEPQIAQLAAQVQMLQDTVHRQTQEMTRLAATIDDLSAKAQRLLEVAQQVLAILGQ